jgi:hypothetical protein
MLKQVSQFCHATEEWYGAGFTAAVGYLLHYSARLHRHQVISFGAAEPNGYPPSWHATGRSLRESAHVQARAPGLGLSDRAARVRPRRRQTPPALFLSRQRPPRSFAMFGSGRCAMHHFVIELGNLDDLAKGP